MICIVQESSLSYINSAIFRIYQKKWNEYIYV